MYIPDNFYLYDDTGSEDNIECSKKDIVYIDDRILLIKKNIDYDNGNDEIVYFLINLKNRIVLSEDCEKYKDFISKSEIEDAALKGCGYQDSVEKGYSNIRKQIHRLKQNSI